MARAPQGAAVGDAGRPVRVAIVGGGCAGMAAAWQLHQCNRHAVPGQPHYAISIYEASWRLGGKGSCGRDDVGRIHEHGLHIWLGFYENAFRMLRECYDEWAALPAKHRKPLAHASIDEALFPEQHIGIASRNRAAQWEAWTGYLPPMEGLPGTEFTPGDNTFSLAGYLARALALTRTLMISVIASPRHEAAPGEPRPDVRSSQDEAAELNLDPDPLGSPAATVERLTDMLRNAALVASAVLLQSITIVEVWLRDFNPAAPLNSAWLDFLEALSTATRRRLAEIANIDEHVRRKTEIIDLVITVAVGLYRDRVLLSDDGLDALNGIDCRKWLLAHGATRTSVDSPFITGLYDLAFCYEDGDRERPALAAGQALRGALRMFFGYRGSLFWRMRSGMGDAVFAPLYRVLQAAGVKFHFLHALRDIEFTPGLHPKNVDNAVAVLHFDRVQSPAGCGLDAAGCWPQADPAARKGAPKPRPFELHRSKDFDAVILATGVDNFVQACSAPRYAGQSFFDLMPRWASMRDAVKTVGTRAAQVWLDATARDLGWRRDAAIVAGMSPPYETWADMTHTLAAEAAWRKTNNVGPPPGPAVHSVHYFCGVLPQREVDAAGGRRDVLEGLLSRQLHDTLFGDMKAFLPEVKGSHVVWRHVQANHVGSERFTLSLPGTLQYRISPLDCSIANMSIAGDWTACGFEEGCVEAAVMSGMLAAHAICGYPDLVDIVGYDHP